MPGNFKHQLLAAGKVPEIIRHPFVRGIADGSYPKEALHFYAQELIALAASFPAQLATLFARCDNENARRVILQNLLENVMLKAQDIFPLQISEMHKGSNS